MPNELWNTTVSGSELEQRQREIDRCMAETIAQRPYSPQWSNDGVPAPLSEDQILARSLDGFVSEAEARPRRARERLGPLAAKKKVPTGLSGIFFAATRVYLNDMIVRAAALALRDHPKATGSYQDGVLRTARACQRRNCGGGRGRARRADHL